MLILIWNRTALICTYTKKKSLNITIPAKQDDKVAKNSIFRIFYLYLYISNSWPIAQWDQQPLQCVECRQISHSLQIAIARQCVCFIASIWLHYSIRLECVCHCFNSRLRSKTAKYADIWCRIASFEYADKAICGRVPTAPHCADLPCW